MNPFATLSVPYWFFFKICCKLRSNSICNGNLPIHNFWRLFNISLELGVIEWFSKRHLLHNVSRFFKKYWYQEKSNMSLLFAWKRSLIPIHYFSSSMFSQVLWYVYEQRHSRPGARGYWKHLKPYYSAVKNCFSLNGSVFILFSAWDVCFCCKEQWLCIGRWCCGDRFVISEYCYCGCSK